MYIYIHAYAPARMHPRTSSDERPAAQICACALELRGRFLMSEVPHPCTRGGSSKASRPTHGRVTHTGVRWTGLAAQICTKSPTQTLNNPPAMNAPPPRFAPKPRGKFLTNLTASVEVLPLLRSAHAHWRLGWLGGPASLPRSAPKAKHESSTIRQR